MLRQLPFTALVVPMGWCLSLPKKEKMATVNCRSAPILLSNKPPTYLWCSTPASSLLITTRWLPTTIAPLGWVRFHNALILPILKTGVKAPTGLKHFSVLLLCVIIRFLIQAVTTRAITTYQGVCLTKMGLSSTLLTAVIQCSSTVSRA